MKYALVMIEFMALVNMVVGFVCLWLRFYDRSAAYLAMACWMVLIARTRPNLNS